MRDLTQHLTTRADDSHAAPITTFSEEHPYISAGFVGLQAQVRFFALHRIKPHAPPLVRAPVNSFEFHSCERTPQVGCLSRSLRHRPQRADIEHPSFTAWTTRVSNPVRSPRFRASASVPVQPLAYASGIPRDIYAFHRYTTNSSSLSDTQDLQYQRQFHG